MTNSPILSIIIFFTKLPVNWTAFNLIFPKSNKLLSILIEKYLSSSFLPKIAVNPFNVFNIFDLYCNAAYSPINLSYSLNPITTSVSLFIDSFNITSLLNHSALAKTAFFVPKSNPKHNYSS